MNRDQFHYAATAALCAEALVVRTSSTETAYRDALIVATADATVDWLTPAHLCRADGIEATQVRVAEGIAAQLCGGYWPCMSRVHRFHFTTTGCPRLNPPEEPQLIAFGVRLHGYQDAGLPGCPHWGYVGYPARKNYLRSRNLGQLGSGEKAFLWLGEQLGRNPKSKVWGHALDLHADDIERCREGALGTSVRAFEELAHTAVVWQAEEGRKGSVPYYLDQRTGCLVRAESLIAIMDARDDRDLVARVRRVFAVATGREMPPFAPFQPGSPEWGWLAEVVR